MRPVVLSTLGTAGKIRAGKNDCNAGPCLADVAVLRELCKGEPLPVSELAKRLNRQPTAISKHLTFLRTTGVAVQGFGRLYRIAPTFQPAPGSPVLDLGDLTLRLSPPA